jgi:hypothetical protein
VAKEKNNDALSKMDDEKLLGQLENWFSIAHSFDTDWKDAAKVWWSYYIGDQWTEEEKAALTERGQAVSTYNHIKPSIDAIIGGERSNRPEIKMVGRTLDDEQIAEVKTSLYDFIVYNSDSDSELDMALLDTYITGRGWKKVVPKEDKDGDADLYHEFVDYRNMFIDGMSRKDDMSDCRYLHQAVFTDEDIIKASFPDYKEGNRHQDFFESSSEEDIWTAGEDRTRVRLIETWYRDENGDVNSVIWVKGQILEKYDKPYEMNDFPFVQITLNRDLENRPYGLVKTMVSPQDEVNKRHSKALHYLNSKQVHAEEEAFKNLDDAKKNLAKPDGVVLYNENALQNGSVIIKDNAPLADAHTKLMEVARNEILTLVGLNAGYMGQSGSSESGAKTTLNIQQAQNVLIPILNKIRQARHREAKITMALATEFYTSERVIRITQENGTYGFMAINTLQEDENNVINTMNDISNNDIDVIVADAPPSLNDRQEQFDLLMRMQQNTAMPIPPNILLRYSNVKDKHKLAAEIEQHNNLQAQLQQAAEQMQQMADVIAKQGGDISQYEQQITQIQTRAAVDKEVANTKIKMANMQGKVQGATKAT